VVLPPPPFSARASQFTLLPYSLSRGFCPRNPKPRTLGTAIVLFTGEAAQQALKNSGHIVVSADGPCKQDEGTRMSALLNTKYASRSQLWVSLLVLGRKLLGPFQPKPIPRNLGYHAHDSMWEAVEQVVYFVWTPITRHLALP
jgi:hypothetical protein